MEANTSALTVEDVAARYKVHKQTVYNMAKDGRLKHGGTGRQLRFSAVECDRVFLGVEPKDKEEAA